MQSLFVSTMDGCSVQQLGICLSDKSSGVVFLLGL
jgi:hypothetical protein